MKVYSANAIANWFIKKSSYKITHLKIQKLVFFAHGWKLALTNEPLILEKIEAWIYGPVISEIYHNLKENGSGNINSLIMATKRIPPENLLGTIEFYNPEVEDEDTITIKLLDRIWEVYGKMTTYEITELSHVKDSPWEIATKSKQLIITDESIKTYYKKLAGK